MNYIESKIIKNYQVENNIYKLIVEYKGEIEAGQFFMIKTVDDRYLLPRPISVNDYYFYERENNCGEFPIENIGELVFLYRIGKVGSGTEMLSNLTEGESVRLIGPSGNGFDLNKLNGNIAIVGGGIGIAPLKLLIDRLQDVGKKADVFLGFNDFVYELDEFQNSNTNVFVSTVDGSYGTKGFVTSMIDFDSYDSFVACGPTPMMIALIKECRKHGKKCYVSLEKRMGCGIGACLGCSIKTTEGMKRVCKEGPVFDSDILDLDSLMD